MLRSCYYFREYNSTTNDSTEDEGDLDYNKSQELDVRWDSVKADIEVVLSEGGLARILEEMKANEESCKW